MQSVAMWLSKLELAQYAEAFARNHIGLDLLPSLTDQDLRDLGIQSLGHRKRLLKAIESLRAGGAAEGSTASIPAHSAAQRRQLTVMFCDLVGSTQLSARLDPEELREVVRAYQSTCAEEIARFEGHIAQYLGDGLLVYFGHPQAHEDDAERAVRAGLGILDGLKSLNARLQASYAVTVSVRIGIHTGLVVVGEMGDGERQETLALGETPNVAARLQGIASPDSIVISAATHHLVHRLFASRDLGTQILKGISDPLSCHQILGEASTMSMPPEQTTPLVGRNQEVGLLLDRWEQVNDGAGQVVILTGEAGIGKSRLLATVRSRINDQPHSRLELRCSPYYQHSPLYPVVDALPRVM